MSSFKSGLTGEPGRIGPKGYQGSQGQYPFEVRALIVGEKGITGDKGQLGDSNRKGQVGWSGLEGDKGKKALEATKAFGGLV